MMWQENYRLARGRGCCRLTALAMSRERSAPPHFQSWISLPDDSSLWMSRASHRRVYEGNNVCSKIQTSESKLRLCWYSSEILNLSGRICETYCSSIGSALNTFSSLR
jgi:hypothetical protein